MTTIAYRAGVLAADTLVTGNGHRLGNVTKVRKFGSVLAAGSGTLSNVQRFLDWVAEGMKGEAPGMGDENRPSEGVVIHDDWIVTFDPTGCDRIKADYYAIGSGRELALGAMAAGADAEGAVRAAMLHDASTGGDVIVLRR